MKKKVIALVLAQMLVINCAALPVFAGQEGTVGANSIRPAASNQAEESVVSPDEMEEDAEGSFVTGQEEMTDALSLEEAQYDSLDDQPEFGERRRLL